MRKVIVICEDNKHKESLIKFTEKLIKENKKKSKKNVLKYPFVQFHFVKYIEIKGKKIERDGLTFISRPYKENEFDKLILPLYVGFDEVEYMKKISVKNEFTPALANYASSILREFGE